MDNIRLKFLCDSSIYATATIGMGFNFIPEDARSWCNWLQKQWNPVNMKRQNVMMQLMRDGYKSTSITQSYPTWLLSQNPNLSILIASKVTTNASGFLDTQRKRWASSDFEDIYGRWISHKTKSNVEKIVIEKRTINRKEASLTAAGMGTTLTSQHFDVIIADDITTKEDAYSQASRTEAMRFYKSLFDLLDKKHGLLLLIGTCWHSDDVLQTVKKQQSDKIKEGVEPFKIYYRPAKNEKTGKFNFSWVNDGFLAQIRADKADIRDFSANYLLKPIPDSFKIFNPEKFYFFDKEPEKFNDITMFIDPSIKDTKKSDYAAIVWIGRSEGLLYLLGANIRQRKPSDTIKAIGEEWQRLEEMYPDVEKFAYMETVAMQEFLKDEAVTQLCNDGIYVPINEHPQNTNKIARITSMEKYVTSGIVRFRKNWKDLPDYKLLIQHLDDFPLGDHDDGADALEGAVSNAMYLSSDPFKLI